MRRQTHLLCVCMLALLLGVAAVVLNGGVLSPARADEVKTVQQPTEIRVPLGAPGDTLGAEFRLGSPLPMTVKLEWADGKSQSIRVVPADEKIGTRVLPAASLDFQGLVNYFIRPRPLRYTDEQQEELVKNWESFPSATETFVKFEAVPDGRGVSIYLDDRYAGRADKDVSLQALNFLLPAGGSVRNERSYRRPAYDNYLPINFAAVAQPGAMKEAKISLPTGLQQVKDIPIIVADGDNSGDISRVRQMKGSWALECDEYLSRTTFDGMPESQLITVPQAYYHRAWVLFAVDPNPEKDPIMTVRLTRFAGGSEVGRGSAFADVYVELPRKGEKLPKNITQVGTVRHQAENGEVVLPLYLAEVDLPIGDMIDLLSTDTQDPAAELRIGPYLDFEILGRRGDIGVQWDSRHKPTGAPSAANIFGVTLERAPAELRLAQTQPGNIFHNDETPETTAIVRAVQAGNYTLTWVISDVDGKEMRRDSKTVKLAAGQQETLSIPLAMKDIGYYGLKFDFSDASGRRILAHDASFAILGKDTREAGYESPYSVWWFGGSHLTVSDIDIAGPLHLKAGLRRTVSDRYSEAEMAPWKMTIASFGNNFQTSDQDNFEAAKTRVEALIKKQQERYPNCKNVLIFHESGANTMPEELAGVEPAFTEAQRQFNEKKAKYANLAGQFYREKFPELKIIVGNTSGTAKLMADLFRSGFDRQYCDYIGIETPGQTFMPEVISEHNIMAVWMAREIGRKYGHEIPMTGCHEFTYRVDRTIGAETQAEYYVRDILISHAYKFDHIGPGVLDDPGGSYYNTLWGGSGILQRSPLLYPKPAYVAIANATKVLDKTKLSRVIPTGSLTVYALELKRDRTVPDCVYAMWVPRGEAELLFDFGRDLNVTLIDLYGKTTAMKTSNGKVTVPTSTRATYLISPAAVRTVSISKRTFNEDQPPAGHKPANRMDNIDDWREVTDYSLYGDFSRRGDFVLRQVEDPEKGTCLELELKKAPSLEPLVSKYTSLKLKRPVEVPGQPHTIGLWVKGNSNWGSVYFEIMDGDLRLWRSNGGYNDWPGDLAVNFDGWRFLRFHIDSERSPIKNVSPGFQWVSSGGGNKPTYPVKIVGIYVTVRHQAVDPVEMRDVVPILRFKDIGAYDY